MIDTKPIQTAGSGHDSWPEAPDLQLDCFSSDDEETIDESEPESTSSSDDSSVKEIAKSPPNLDKVTIANNNSIECNPGTSRANQMPTISSTLDNVTASPATSTVVATALIKCPEAVTPSTSASSVSKSTAVNDVRASIASKLVSRNGHLVIDLTKLRRRVEQSK